MHLSSTLSCVAKVSWIHPQLKGLSQWAIMTGSGVRGKKLRARYMTASSWGLLIERRPSPPWNSVDEMLSLPPMVEWEGVRSGNTEAILWSCSGVCLRRGLNQRTGAEKWKYSLNGVSSSIRRQIISWARELPLFELNSLGKVFYHWQVKESYMVKPDGLNIWLSARLIGGVYSTHRRPEILSV